MPFQCSVRQAVLAILGFATAVSASSLVYSCFPRLHQHMSASLQVWQFFQSYKFSASYFGHSGHLAVTVEVFYLISFCKPHFKKACLILPVRVKMLAIFGDPKTQKK